MTVFGGAALQDIYQHRIVYPKKDQHLLRFANTCRFVDQDETRATKARAERGAEKKAAAAHRKIARELGEVTGGEASPRGRKRKLLEVDGDCASDAGSESDSDMDMQDSEGSGSGAPSEACL